MDNIKKSKLLELRTKLIKDIRAFNEYDGKEESQKMDCFTMFFDYEENVKLIKKESEALEAKLSA